MVHIFWLYLVVFLFIPAVIFILVKYNQIKNQEVKKHYLQIYNNYNLEQLKLEEVILEKYVMTSNNGTIKAEEFDDENYVIRYETVCDIIGSYVNKKER